MTRPTRRRSLATLKRELATRQEQTVADAKLVTQLRGLVDVVYPVVAEAVEGGAAELERVLPSDLDARVRVLRSLVYRAVSRGACVLGDSDAERIAAQLDWLPPAPAIPPLYRDLTPAEREEQHRLPVDAYERWEEAWRVRHGIPGPAKEAQHWVLRHRGHPLAHTDHPDTQAYLAYYERKEQGGDE